MNARAALPLVLDSYEGAAPPRRRVTKVNDVLCDRVPRCQALSLNRVTDTRRRAGSAGSAAVPNRFHDCLVALGLRAPGVAGPKAPEDQPNATCKSPIPVDMATRMSKRLYDLGGVSLSLPPLEAHRWMAEMVYQRVKEGIESAQAQLGEDEELVVTYHLPGTTIQVSSVGFHNPSLIYLFGIDELGNEVSVQVAMQTLALILRRVKREPERPRREIGFTAQISS
jgi:hypothetical protein